MTSVLHHCTGLEDEGHNYFYARVTPLCRVRLCSSSGHLCSSRLWSLHGMGFKMSKDLSASSISTADVMSNLVIISLLWILFCGYLKMAAHRQTKSSYRHIRRVLRLLDTGTVYCSSKCSALPFRTKALYLCMGHHSVLHFSKTSLINAGLGFWHGGGVYWICSVQNQSSPV